MTELRITQTLIPRNSVSSIKKLSSELIIPVTTDGSFQPGTVAVPASPSKISPLPAFGFSDAGWCWMRNEGAYPVQFGYIQAGTLYPVGVMKAASGSQPAETALFRLYSAITVSFGLNAVGGASSVSMMAWKD